MLLRRLLAGSVMVGAGLALVASCSASSTSAPVDPGGTGGGSGSGAGAGGESDGSGGTSGTGGGSLFDVEIPDSADGTIDPDAACLTETTTAKFVPATILFVIDKSGSMKCNPPPEQPSSDCTGTAVNPGNPSKWDLTRDALKTAIQGMPGTTSVGAVYFPKVSGPCVLPITADVPIAALTSGQRGKLETSLDGVSPNGQTPLVGSMLNGFIYLDGKTLTGNVFVILITDGAESCGGDPVELVAEVTDQATNKQVRTFVIGSPGSEQYRSVLSDVAFNGATAVSSGCDHGSSQPDVGDCHFDMTTTIDFAGALNQVLEDISGAALSCEFDIPATTPDGKKVDYGYVNVRYTPGGGGKPELFSKLADSAPCSAADGGGADGWQYNQDKSKIILCGPACDKVQSDPTATVDILFGCESHSG